MLANFTPLNNAFDIARFSCAYAVIFFALAISVVTLPEINNTAIKMPLLLMVIYFWSIYRPTILPVWLVFIMGGLVDILVMTPLGFNMVILLIVQRFVISQRRFLMAQPFMLLWLGFSFVSAAYFTSLGILQIIVNKGTFDMTGAALSCLLSFFVYPFMHMLLHVTHKIIPAPEKRKSIALHRPKKRPS